MSAIRDPLADHLLVHDLRSGTAVYGRIGPGVPLHYALDTGSSEALKRHLNVLQPFFTAVEQSV